MPKFDRALYAFAATMILLAVVGHAVFLTPHATSGNRVVPSEQQTPSVTPFEGSLMVRASIRAVA